MRAIELFAGAGGLAIGVARAGFRPSMIIERDRWCCDTLRENRRLVHPDAEPWPAPIEGDIRSVDFRVERGEVALVTGGPPCQPFSLGGRHQAHADQRDMWSEAVRVIDEVRPQAFLFENVRGLTRQSFTTYLGYILLRLQHPSIAKREGEEWTDHLKRLQRHHTGAGDIEYRVIHQLLDTADYGVPQRRHRVVFVGFRTDVDAGWSFPGPTHTAEALAYDQCRGGEYWERHEVPEKYRTYSNGNVRFLPLGNPWLTIRDALVGLPDPRTVGAVEWTNHRFQAGAKSYPGHTGSLIDMPAKALKAGVHGVPGGENMMRSPDGSIRYFTVREAARLQAFPDAWRFHCSWSESMRQLGNAVPTTLGEVVARSIKGHLEGLRG